MDIGTVISNASDFIGSIPVIGQVAGAGAALGLFYVLSKLNIAIPNKARTLILIIFVETVAQTVELAATDLGINPTIWGVPIFQSIHAFLLISLMMVFLPMIYSYYRMWGVGG